MANDQLTDRILAQLKSIDNVVSSCVYEFYSDNSARVYSGVRTISSHWVHMHTSNTWSRLDAVIYIVTIDDRDYCIVSDRNAINAYHQFPKLYTIRLLTSDCHYFTFGD